MAVGGNYKVVTDNHIFGDVNKILDIVFSWEVMSQAEACIKVTTQNHLSFFREPTDNIMKNIKVGARV